MLRTHTEDHIARLLSKKHRCESFHEKYVSNFEMWDIFAEEKLIQMLINLLHTCFIIQEETSEPNLVDSYFDYFLYAASLIIVKFESPSKTKALITKIVEKNLNLRIIRETESTILNKATWQLFLETPVEMTVLLLNLFLREEEIENAREVQQNISDWQNFSLGEWSMYKSYDLFTITIGSIFLALRVGGLEAKIAEFVALVREFDLGDMRRIQNCVQHMVALMNSSENELPEDQETKDSENEALNYSSDHTEDNTPPRLMKRNLKRFPKCKKQPQQIKKLQKTHKNKKKRISKQLFVSTRENLQNKNSRKIRQTKMSDYIKSEKVAKREEKQF